MSLPGGMNGVADGYNIACPTHIQVGPREGDEARVSHCMLVPTKQITHSEVRFYFVVPCAITKKPSAHLDRPLQNLLIEQKNKNMPNNIAKHIVVLALLV